MPSTWSDRLLVIIWAFIPLTIAAMLVHGWRTGEILGAAAFSLLPASLLAAVSAAIAIARSSPLSRWAYIVWLAICVVTLCAAMALGGMPREGSDGDAETLLVYAMLILTVPLGALAPVVLTTATDLLRDDAGQIYLMATWMVFFVFGYLQWFILLPKAIRRLKTWRRS